MNPDIITPVVTWEMYGPGSTIQFTGVREADGFGVTITRDDSTLIATAASDVAALLSYSALVREQLQQQGYAFRPLAARATQFLSGPCWGPGAPLDASLLSLR